jgi:rRNA-processing protein FCF1
MSKESNEPKEIGNNTESELEDIFLLASTYPKAELIFKNHKLLEEIKDECLFVVDTNALLIPYKQNPATLDGIEKVYLNLVSQNRLFIPGHVAREFAKNRVYKVKNIHESLSQKKDNFNQSIKTIERDQIESSSLIRSLEGYQEILDIERKMAEEIDNINKIINSLITEYEEKYKKTIDKVLKKIADWNWNDPVSLMYAKVFANDVVIDPHFDKEEVKRDMKWRNQHKIPPGFKDASKGSNSVGDLLIWKTILFIGNNHKKDVVFVSGETKSDWWLRSHNSKLLYPRYELVDEFRRSSEGQSFHMIKLSDLLSWYGADDSVIKEVRQEEEQISLRKIKEEKRILLMKARKAVNEWLLEENKYQRVEKRIQERIPFRIKRSFIDSVFMDEAGNKTAIKIEVVLANLIYARFEVIESIKKTITNFKLTMAGVEMLQQGVSQLMLVFVGNSEDTAVQAEVFVKDADFEEWYLEFFRKISCVFGYLDNESKFKPTSELIIKNS